MGFREWFNADPVSALFYIVAIPATVILILQTILLLFGLGHGDGSMDSDTSGIGDHFDLGHDGHFEIGHADVGHDGHFDLGHGGHFVDLNHDGIPDDLQTDVHPDMHPDFHDDADGMHGDSGLRLLTVRGLVAFFAIGGWAGIAALELGASRYLAVITALLAGTAALFLVALFFKWVLTLQYNGTMQIPNAVGKTGEVYLTVPAGNAGRGKVNVIVGERLVELDAVTACDRALRYGERVKVTGLSDSNTVIVEPE